MRTGAEIPVPPGFKVGHWSDPVGRTGCTVVIAPAATRGGIDVRGGGTGTREIEVARPLSGTPEVSAVMLTGGSAYGLAAADGAARWLEEHGHGYPTPAARVAIVPAAVIYDLAEGDPEARPGPDAGYAACEAADDGVPARGRVGAGTGAAVGKILGRDSSTPAGVGYAAARSGGGATVAAVAVVNAFGDVIGGDGSVMAGPHDDHGRVLSSESQIAAMPALPHWTGIAEENTTLVCLATDASLTKPGCSRVAQMASAGIARAVAPVFSDVDGDVVFCLASGRGEPDRFATITIGTIAAAVTAAAIRDAIRAAAA